MAINPETTTTVKVSELASAGFNTTDLVPHEVGGYLKKGTLQDLATFIGGIISTEGSVAFKAVHITDGQTLPATTSEEFILVGPGTYPNVGGGSPITTTEPLSALVSNGTYWYIGVEIPITASGTWGAIAGELSDQTDLQNALDLKADLVGGKVPSSQLPSYVDDVVEVANYAALPATGETGKIYITLDTNKVYRWSGSAYIEIAANSAVWGSITGTLSSQTDLQNALNLKANDNAVVKLTGDQTITSGIKTFASYIIADAFVKAGGTNTQYLMADGSVSTGGTIQGGGTTNYIPRWLNSNTLGDSIIYSNVTKIGIGSQITNFATHNGQLMLKSGNTTTGPQSVVGIEIMQKDADAGYGMKIYTNSDTDQCGIATRHNSATWTERLSIKTATGNVGIGTTSPATALDVNGVISITAAAPYIQWKNTSNTRLGYIQHNATDLVMNADTGAIVFTNSGAERMRITSGGNVGIGTTSPLNKLDVAGNISLSSGGANVFRILQSVQAAAYNGPGFYSQSDIGYGVASGGTHRFIGIDGNTEIMRITSGGNVGIGTTSPSTKLDVVGAITASGGFFNSDMRLKQLTDYNYNVSDIKPITYLWKDGRDNKKHVGYSAQEVQKVMPDAVNEGTDGMLSVNYVEVLVAKIAQMEKEIELLKSK